MKGRDSHIEIVRTLGVQHNVAPDDHVRSNFVRILHALVVLLLSRITIAARDGRKGQEVSHVPFDMARQAVDAEPTSQIISWSAQYQLSYPGIYIASCP